MADVALYAETIKVVRDVTNVSTPLGSSPSRYTCLDLVIVPGLSASKYVNMLHREIVSLLFMIGTLHRVFYFEN